MSRRSKGNSILLSHSKSPFLSRMANSSTPLTKGLQPWNGRGAAPARTCGPVGWNDQGDPGIFTLLGDTPGTLGVNDRADFVTRSTQSSSSVEPQMEEIIKMVHCGGSPQKGIPESDYQSAAETLEVDVASIKAIVAVETPRGAFDDMGRPTILFERHYFHKLTGGAFDAADPSISNTTSGGYGKFSTQYPKLIAALELDKNNALKSASWGAFQIMGANYVAAGYASVRDFVIAMMESEANHLKAVTRFIKANPKMHKALKNKDWTGFAKYYNGPKYADNKYDEKLRNKVSELSNVATLAGAAQSNTGYKADLWLNTTLQPMTKLWKGMGGEDKSDFFFGEEDAREATGAYQGSQAWKFAETLWRLAQVAPSKVHGFRDGIREYAVIFPTPAAMGICQANPALGSGSVLQYFIPNWQQQKSIVETGRTHQFAQIKIPNI